MRAVEDNPAIPFRKVRGKERGRMLRAYLNYGLIASVVVWAAIVGVMAYRLHESPWRWAFVGLVFCGGLTIAAILWIKRYVDRMSQADEKQESKL
jgi:MFS family permease